MLFYSDANVFVPWPWPSRHRPVPYNIHINTVSITLCVMTLTVQILFDILFAIWTVHIFSLNNLWYSKEKFNSKKYENEVWCLNHYKKYFSDTVYLRRRVGGLFLARPDTDLLYPNEKRKEETTIRCARIWSASVHKCLTRLKIY